MNKEELIQEATRKGLVPGVTVKSKYGTVSVLPPHTEWYVSGSDLFARCPSIDVLAIMAEGVWATLVSPAYEGLEDGMAVECGPAMRAAILERAKGLGLPISCEDTDWADANNHPEWVPIWSNRGLGLTGGVFANINYIPLHEFLRRLEHTKPAQPKITVTSNGKEVEVVFTADGIEVNSSCVSREQVLEVADRMEGKRPGIDWASLCNKGTTFPTRELWEAAVKRLEQLGMPRPWDPDNYKANLGLHITAGELHTSPGYGDAPYGAFMDAIEALAPKPLSIGGYPVEVREKDVKIGCTVATHEVVRAVAERLKQKA